MRLLKAGVVFGPTDRQGLEQLLAAGRVSSDDQVSEHNAPWVRIADYLAAPRAAASPGALLRSKKKGDLSLLSGGRIFCSLHRDDVERLRIAARVGDDDLICALGGPWMRVGDFFAPSPAQKPSPVVAAATVPTSMTGTQATAAPSAAAATPIPLPIPIPIPLPPTFPAPPDASSSPAVPSQASGWNPPPIAPVVLPQPRAAMAGSPTYSVKCIPPPGTRLNDEWFVRVRGIHSAPLRKHHIKALYEAREVTLDNVARHVSWSENEWRPIKTISELADIG